MAFIAGLETDRALVTGLVSLAQPCLRVWGFFNFFRIKSRATEGSEQYSLGQWPKALRGNRGTQCPLLIKIVSVANINQGWHSQPPVFARLTPPQIQYYPTRMHTTPLFSFLTPLEFQEVLQDPSIHQYCWCSEIQTYSRIE